MSVGCRSGTGRGARFDVLAGAAAPRALAVAEARGLTARVCEIPRGAPLALAAGMTIYAAFAFALLALCTTAFADPGAPRASSFKLRVTVHDGASGRTFKLIVGPQLPCATASEKLPEHQIELKACASNESHMLIDWYTRRGTTESRGSSALPLEPGATVTLGTERDARVEVTVQ